MICPHAVTHPPTHPTLYRPVCPSTIRWIIHSHTFFHNIFTRCIRPRYLTTAARAVVGVVKAGTYLGSNSIILGDDAYAPQVMARVLIACGGAVGAYARMLIVRRGTWWCTHRQNALVWRAGDVRAGGGRYRRAVSILGSVHVD
jgi:hypothetical protein